MTSIQTYLRYILFLFWGCGICEPPSGPCIPWVEVGATYEVELVQHFDSRFDDDPNQPSPFIGYARNERSCGEGLDLHVGVKLRITADNRVDEPTTAGCMTCYQITATTTIDGMIRMSTIDGDLTYALGDPRFADMFQAEIDGDCHGRYWIGIMPVSTYFLENSKEYVATDHMLFREFTLESDFTTEEAEACRRPGSTISADWGRCWDSWAVRVRDSSGRLLTKDQPQPDTSVVSESDAEISDRDAD